MGTACERVHAEIHATARVRMRGTGRRWAKIVVVVVVEEAMGAMREDVRRCVTATY